VSGVARGVEVKLLGQTLVVRSDLDPDRLSQIVEHVRRKAEEASGGSRSASPLSVALLAALNVAEELFAARAGAEAEAAAAREAEARLSRLAETVGARLSAGRAAREDGPAARESHEDSPAVPVMGADPLSH
jgi:cell division protein ZapA (FtsZ GTPase activity inhibitor)